MGSSFGATWEDPEGGFYQILSKKSFKTKPNTPYGGETSPYSLLQGGGVCSKLTCSQRMQTLNLKWSDFLHLFKLEIENVNLSCKLEIDWSNCFILLKRTAVVTMAMVCHKSYISMGRNFNNILKYNVLSSNFSGYLKITKTNLRMASKIFE